MSFEADLASGEKKGHFPKLLGLPLGQKRVIDQFIDMNEHYIQYDEFI